MRIVTVYFYANKHILFLLQGCYVCIVTGYCEGGDMWAYDTTLGQSLKVYYTCSLQFFDSLCLFSLQIWDRAELMKKLNGAYFPEEVFLSRSCVCLCVYFFPILHLMLSKFLRNSANGSLNYCWQWNTCIQILFCIVTWRYTYMKQTIGLWFLSLIRNASSLIFLTLPTVFQHLSYQGSGCSPRWITLSCLFILEMDSWLLIWICVYLPDI